MRAKADVATLLSRMYDAASGNCGWGSFLEQCSEVLRAASGVIVVDNELVGTYRVDEIYVAKYASDYAAKNIYIQRSRHLLRPGAVVQGEDLCLNTELEKSEYYNDYLRPQDIYYSIASVAEQDGRVHMGFVRPKRAETFGTSEKEMLRFLTPHIQSAIQLQQRLRCLECRNAAMLEVLDYLPFALFLLDGSGLIAESNRTAAAVLALGDGIRVANRRLAAMRTEDNARLQCLVANTLGVYSGKDVKAGGIVRISRPSFRRPYLVCVAPLRFHGSTGISGRIAAAVFVSDPDSEGKPNSAAWTEYFEFTPAENRLASLLLAGKSVNQAADLLNVSPNTTRTQLKSIMAKTGTRRQSELIRLLMSTMAYAIGGSRKAPSGY